MLNRILVYGLIAGVVVGVPNVLIPLFLTNGHSASYGMLIGYTVMLISLSAVFLGVKRQRDVGGGGVIGFLPALGMGLAISLIATVFYVLAWEFYLAVSHNDFAGSYARAMIAAEETKGVTGPALAKFVAEMDQFRKDYSNPIYRMAMTSIEILPVGVLVSLVSAGLLSFSRFLPARRAA